MKNTILLFILFSTSVVSCRSQNKPAHVAEVSNDSIRNLFWKNIPEATGYVTDFENIFTVDEEKTLDSLISAFEKETTIEIAVITIDSTMTSADSLDLLTLHIGNTWGVGKKEKDNGVAIGISKVYKRMRIQNGFGIEKILSDAEIKEIMDSSFIPSYKQDKYFEGTRLGLTAMMDALRKKTTVQFQTNNINL